MRRRAQTGYSLLELSIVLVITGVMAGSSLLLGMSQLENARRKANEKKMDAIETALMSFRTVNGRLPCPASYTLSPSSASFGVQVADPGTCTSAPFGPVTEVVEGAVPVRTLGLSDDFIYDAWGRKFAYAIDRIMTATNVFPSYPTNESCGHITINDQAGTARSTGAIYTLLSFGPTGHGGYIQSSTRNSTGSTNANEQQNCHCNDLAVATAYDATYVQRDALETATAANAFDDILRYKERWQLSSVDDNVTANDTYYGPELLVGTTASNYIYAYRITCDVPTFLSSLDTLPSAAVNGIDFSKDNAYVMVANSALLSPLSIYKRSGLALNLLVGQPDVTPTSTANVAVLSNNIRYLAVGVTSTPYLYIYKRVSDSFTKLTAPATLPGAKVNGLAFTPNSIHLVVAQQASSSKIMRVYKFGNENYALQSTQPTQPAGTNGYGPSFSFDATYLAIGSDTTPYLTIYQRYIDTFTKLTEPSVPPASTVYQTAWSHESRYLAAALASSPYIVIYKRSGSTFTKLSNPADLPTGTAYNVAWSRSGLYLAVAHTTSPYITVYKRSGDTFTKITNPDVLPASNALSTVFYTP